MASYSLQDMYRRPGFLLKRCHQISMAVFLDECREFSLTQSQYGCLRALEGYPGIDQIALGRLVGLDRSTAGMVIKTLSERGMIERVVNRRDKRRMRLKLSPAGKRLLVEIAPAAARAQERVLRVLPPEFACRLSRHAENVSCRPRCADRYRRSPCRRAGAGSRSAAAPVPGATQHQPQSAPPRTRRMKAGRAARYFIIRAGRSLSGA